MGSLIKHTGSNPRVGQIELNDLVFRRESYSVKSGNIVYIRVIKFKLA